MAQSVPLHIKSGIPYARTFMVELPTGRDWWTTDTQYEFLAQIRVSDSYRSGLLLDLTEFLTDTMETPDVIRVDLIMDGSDTRRLSHSGHYDVVMSDINQTDPRAYVISWGQVHHTDTVSADQEELNIGV